LDFFDESVTFKIAGIRSSSVSFSALTAGAAAEGCWATPGTQHIKMKRKIAILERTKVLLFGSE
jgi:hypothetical protein